MKKRRMAEGLARNEFDDEDDAEYEGEEQEGVGSAGGGARRGLALSPKRPNKKIGKGTVQVETGLPADRNKGYRKDYSRQRFTGADARAALVGAYEKKKGKRPAGFPRTSHSY